MQIVNSSILSEVNALAHKYGEANLDMVSGFKSKIFIGEKLVFKLSEEGKGFEKEKKVLEMVSKKLPPEVQAFVPKIVAIKTIDGIGDVQIQTRLTGAHPQIISDDLAKELGRFLLNLHEISAWDKITEFEGDGEFDLKDYLLSSSEKFYAKLKPIVDPKDLKLLEKIISKIKNGVDSLNAQTPLVLIHKDIHLSNLLVSNSGNLTGVVDWGAAQTAPREWEFSIIRQRAPEHWEKILSSYGAPLNNELLDLCGLVQTLRFWKSFPNDLDFVREQRKYAEAILSYTRIL